MRRVIGLAPTRSGLLAGQRRLERVSKGAALLRRKREAVVGEIVRLARPASDARRLIAETAAQAYPALLGALAMEGSTGLRAIAWPVRELELNISTTQVWGIPAAAIGSRPQLRRTLEARGLTAMRIDPATAATATAFEGLAELLLDAAARELLLQRLGVALTRTSRQVNTLEQQVAPSLRQAVTRTRRDLEERERDEHARLGWVLRATARNVKPTVPVGFDPYYTLALLRNSTESPK